MAYLSDDDVNKAAIDLDKLLQVAKIPKRACYKPSEIQVLLNISYSMFINMCDAWEPIEVVNRDNKGLESYRVGTHRRIPHHGLVEWLAVNKTGE